MLLNARANVESILQLIDLNKLPEITRRLCIRHTTSKTDNLAYIKTIIDDRPIIFVSRMSRITL